MFDDLLEDLSNYAFEKGIGVEIICASSSTPSICLKNKRLILLNISANTKKLPFIYAHEIAHIINDDCMDVYNNGLPYYRSRCEHRADIKALDILLPIYLNHADYVPENISPIINQLCIPEQLSEEVRLIMSNLITNK